MGHPSSFIFAFVFIAPFVSR